MSQETISSSSNFAVLDTAAFVGTALFSAGMIIMSNYIVIKILKLFYKQKHSPSESGILITIYRDEGH